MGQITRNDIRKAKVLQYRGEYTVEDLRFILDQFIPRIMQDLDYGQRFPERPLRHILPDGLDRTDFYPDLSKERD